MLTRRPPRFPGWVVCLTGLAGDGQSSCRPSRFEDETCLPPVILAAAVTPTTVAKAASAKLRNMACPSWKAGA